MKMWVKWECFSVKGNDRFLVGNGVRRWELLLMAELSASKRKKSESETVKERESVRKWGGFESKLYLKTFNDEASFYLLYYYFSIGLLFHYCGFWEKTQWTGIVVSVRLWVCIWLPVKETRSEIIFYLLVLFLFILSDFFFFFSMWILGSICFLYWEEVRVQTVVRAWGMWCHVIRFGRRWSGHSGRGSRDCDKDGRRWYILSVTGLWWGDTSAGMWEDCEVVPAISYFMKIDTTSCRFVCFTYKL